MAAAKGALVTRTGLAVRTAAVVSAVGMIVGLLVEVPVNIRPASAASQLPDPAHVIADPAAHGEAVVSRTATSTDYLNRDGTHTMAISAGQVNFRSSSGAWQPMDTSLVHGLNGRLVERAGGSELDAAETSASGSSLLGLSGSGWSAGVGLAGASGGVPGVVRGASVEYDNLTPGVDLQVAFGGSSAETLLIVHQAGVSSWDLSVSATGSILQAQPDGTVVLVSHGQVVATFLGGIAQDSAPSPLNTPVSMSLVSPTVLRVSIDGSWLSDPSRVFPVSVDPDVELGPPASGEYDAYAQQNTPTTNYNGAAQYNSSLGAYVDVAGYTTFTSVQEYDFQHFDVSPLAGKLVLGAQWKDWVYAESGANAPFTIWPTGGSWTASSITWNTLPGHYPSPRINTTAPSTGNWVYVGCGSACYGSGDAMTGLVTGWVNGSRANYGLDLDTAGLNSYVKLGAVENGGVNFTPTIFVTYVSYPNTPTGPSTTPATTCTTGSGRPYINTVTPTLSAVMSTSDGGSLQGSFEIWHTNGAEIGGQNLSASVASGSRASWTVGSGNFVDGSTYSWRSRGWNGYLYSSSYSPWCEFTIDTDPPPAPTISSPTFLQNGWSAGTGAFNYTSSDPGTNPSGVAGYLTSLDGAAWSSVSSSTSTTLSNLALGWHTFKVEAQDKAGNISPVASYTFGVGDGSLLTPANQDRTQASVALTAKAPAAEGYAAYFYRQGTSVAFTEIPAADVTVPGTNSNVSWPVAADSSGNVSALNWKMAQTVRNAGGGDGLYQVEACFFVNSTDSSPTVCSGPAGVQLAAHAFGASYATEKVGPGQVSLLTGDFQASATDVSVPSATGSLSIGRSITTSDPTGETTNSLAANLHDVESLTGFTGSNATVSLASSPTVLGAHSLQITPASSGTSSDTFAAVSGDLGAVRLGLKPGHTYTFTAREYVPAATGLSPALAARGERPVFFSRIGSGSYSEIDGTAPSATGTWQLVSVTFLVPAGSTEAFIRLYNGFSTGSGLAVYYDDLTLTADGIFGPQWTSDLPGPTAGAADMALTDYTAQGYAVLTGSDGSEDDYQATTPTSQYPITFSGVGDAGDGSILTKVSAGEFDLVDTDGTTTQWKSPDGGATWQAMTVTEAGSSTKTTYSYDASSGYPTQMVGPAPVGVDCSTAPLAQAGCRTLTFKYAQATTATGTASSGWGDFVGNLQSVSFTAADTTNNNNMATIEVAHYAYDNTGLLRASWDPRISPALKTTYSYGPDGRLATVTSPGVNSWTLGYDSTGRLSSVSRPDPAGGTNTTTVVYGIPVTGTVGGVTAPVDLGASAAAGWGQTTDLANYAAAVFPASHVPAGSTPATVSSGDWPYATIHYLDVNGREVSTATYGAGAWQVTTTSFDAHGNTITSLDALARDEALNPAAYPNMDSYVAAQTAGSATRAQLLETANTYNSDGTELLDTLGPTHPVTLAGGSIIDGRAHTHTVYDEGAPNGDVAPGGGPYRLATTITTSVQDTTGADHDTITTQNGYAAINTGDTDGWTLRKPTTKTVVMASGANLVTTTRYDSEGRVIETRLPAGAAGGTAQSTLTTYYIATGTGACVNAAEAGLVCQTAPAAQPTSGAALATITTTYDMWGNPLQVTANTGSATKTTTNLYDPAGRPCVTTIATSGVGDTALPANYTGYDPVSGLPTVIGSISGTAPAACPTTAPTLSAQITTGYDADGRVDSYTDADGNTTQTFYNTDGQPSQVLDPKGTVNYTYDTTGEHRGLLTSLADSQAGTFTATYDPDGKQASEAYPNGLTANRGYDDAGEPTALTYTKGSATWLTFTAGYSAHDQIVAQTSNDQSVTIPVGSAQTYAYDNDGRLVTVTDNDRTVTPSVCTTRTYSYDADSNRQTESNYPPDTNGNCTTTTSPVTVSHSYDEADRINVASGYVYDPLGRTTTISSRDAGGTQMTVGYYADDMVASQTQGAATNTYTLDPAGRIRTIAASSTGVTNTDHYADSSDSPSWISGSDGTWSRNIQGADGNLAAIVTNTSDELQISNLHGDIVATVANTSAATGTDSYFETTEFGQPRASNTAAARYGWLGSKRRDSGDTLGGITLMGKRLYNPNIGRFLSVDPVPGGSANAYDYCNQDPINCTDLNGEFHWRHWFHRTWHAVRRWASNPRTWISIGTGVTTAVFLGGCVVTVLCGAGMAATGLAAIYLTSASANVALAPRRERFTYRPLLAPIRPMATGAVCGYYFASGCASAAYRVQRFLFGRWG